MTVRCNNLEYLSVFVCDFCDTVHVRIAKQLDKTGAFARIHADLDGCSLRINVAKVQDHKVTCAPVARDRIGSIKILECSCDFVSGYCETCLDVRHVHCVYLG